MMSFRLLSRSIRCIIVSVILPKSTQRRLRAYFSAVSEDILSFEGKWFIPVLCLLLSINKTNLVGITHSAIIKIAFLKLKFAK